MEVFDHWWEYFRLLYRCLAPGTIDDHIKDPVSFEKLKRQYDAESNNIAKSKKEQKDAILGILEKGISAEEDRRTVIDAKANSMVSQTGLAVTLIIASLSLVSLGVKELIPKLVILVLLSVSAVNLIAAGLHARHVVSLRYPYPRHDFAGYLGITQPSADYVVSQLFIIERSSQINDVKATFLRISHWFFKAAFVTLFLIVLSGPLLLFSSSIGTHNPPSVVNVEMGRSRGIYIGGDRPEVVQDTAHATQVEFGVGAHKGNREKKAIRPR